MTPPGYFRLFYNWKTLGEIVVLVFFSFIFCYFSGQRGIFPLDQSIVFDGAHRILSGQIPFRDFVTPHSLLVLVYQALIFLVFGTNYFAYLIAAALLNVLAVLFVVRIFALLFPKRRASALIAGAITAVWFYPPFGTPFGEQSAFLLGLLAIDFLLSAVLQSEEARPAFRFRRLFVAGIAAGLTFYCKQNVALFLLPFFILTPCIAWLPDSRPCLRSLISLLSGLLAGLCLPLLFIILTGGWQNFFYFYLLLPIATALRRLSPAVPWWRHFDDLSLWFGFILVLFFALLSIRRRMAPRMHALLELRGRFLNESIAAWLGLYCLVLSHLLRQSMLNSPTMADVYIGILVGLVSAFAIERESGCARVYRNIFYGFVVLVFGFGMFLSWERKVHESVKTSAFPKKLEIPRLESLRWGLPTLMRDGDLSIDDRVGTDISEADITELISFLRTEDKNFFVFPDFSFLYGIVGKSSPQPLLFFHRGLTYPTEYDPAIDSWIVESLIAQQVAIVVIEGKSFFGTERRLRDFPLLTSFLNANFVDERSIGNFKLLTLRRTEEPIE